MKPFGLGGGEGRLGGGTGSRIGTQVRSFTPFWHRLVAGDNIFQSHIYIKIYSKK